MLRTSQRWCSKISTQNTITNQFHISSFIKIPVFSSSAHSVSSVHIYVQKADANITANYTQIWSQDSYHVQVRFGSFRIRPYSFCLPWLDFRFHWRTYAEQYLTDVVNTWYIHKQAPSECELGYCEYFEYRTHSNIWNNNECPEFAILDRNRLSSMERKVAYIGKWWWIRGQSLATVKEIVLPWGIVIFGEILFETSIQRYKSAVLMVWCVFFAGLVSPLLIPGSSKTIRDSGKNINSGSC